MNQMNKKSVLRLLAMGAGKWADGLNQGVAPPDCQTGLHILDKPEDLTIASGPRKGSKWLAGMALTAALLGVGGNIFAQSNMPKYPATVNGLTESDFLPNWSGTGDIDGGHSDIAVGTYASSALGTLSGLPSESINLTGFDFSSLSNDATIVGIEVTLWKSRQVNSSGNGTITDNRIQLLNAGSTENKATGTAWTATTGVTVPSETYGSPSNLWSTTSNNATLVGQLKESNFGLQVRAMRDGGTAFSTREARIHGARVTVYYTLPNSDILLSLTSVSIPTTTYGTSGQVPISISGSYLTTNVTATLNSGYADRFEISKDGSTWGAGPLAYTPSSGTLSPSTFQIRTKANANVGDGTLSDVVAFTSGTADAEQLGVTYDIDAKELTLTGLNVNNKVYNGDNTATASTPTLTGVVSPDVVTFSGTPTFTFESANAATGINVSRSGDYVLGGTAASNYTLTQPGTLTANITGAPLTVTANNASKCFDDVLSSGVILPSSNRYTVTGIVGTDAVASAELTSTGFSSGSAEGTHPITPSNLVLSSGLIGNYSVSYPNGTLTVTDEIKGAVVGAANLNLCNGSAASVNFNLLGGGAPTVSNPFAGEFWIKLDGTTDSVVHAFNITGLPYAVTIPAAKLPAVTSTSKYKIYWKSLSNGTGCATSDPSSLTGFVEITVDRTPTIDVDKSSLIAQCSNIAPTFTVTNPNAVAGATYDVAVNYKTITGGSYATGITAHAFGTLSESALVNNGITADTVTYTFTARKGGSGAPLCSSTPVIVKYVIQPKVRYQDVTVTNDSVCQNDLTATSFSINGLLPNTAHQLTFDITGDDENIGQTATRTSDASGAIVFSAAAFNGGSPAPGTYTFTLTSLTANECDSAITTGNAQTLTIKPTPTFTDVTLTGSEVCQEDLDAETFTISGLLAGKEHTITFDITGDATDTDQSTTRTANDEGVITFTAADFNGGSPAPGTYTFTLRSLSVDGCSINITSDNAQEITILPTPTFDSLSATSASVCVNDLEAETMTIHGLLPSKSHIVTFAVIGESESGTPQTATLPSNDEGKITFDGTAFNGGSPAVGNYTVTIIGIEVDGCSLTVPSGNNTKMIEIKPTPKITGVSFGETSVCFSDIESAQLTFSGMLPNSIAEVTLSGMIEFDGVGMPLSETTTTVEVDEFGNGQLTSDFLPLSEFEDSFLTTMKIQASVSGVSVDGCDSIFATPLESEIIIYKDADVTSLDVNMASVCADNRGDALFTINGNFAAGVDYVVNYTITKGSTAISTDDYTFNLEAASDEITFPASIFAGSSVVPGTYKVAINSVTLNGCIVTFDSETKPSANLELTGTPIVTKANDTIYVLENCMTEMPDYRNTEHFTFTSCISNVTVEQLAPNAPESDVIGYGGDRTVIFKMTSNIDDGGSLVTYDSIKVHIADTTRPTAIAFATDTVYLTNEGTASLTAAAINNASSDNCTGAGSLNLKVSRGSAPATTVVFTCADKDAPVAVTLHVKDASGNASSAITNVTVLDTIRPVITGTMPNLIVDKGALCTNEMPDYTIALEGIAYTDNCGTGFFEISQFPEAGTIIAKSIESQLVTITVKDASQNAATTSFTITYEDNTAPVFAGVPSADVTVGAASGECAASVELPNITATDNCTDEVMVISERGDGMEDGSEFAIGTTVITYIATDAEGNADTGTYNVVVTPTVTAPWIVLESEDFYVPEVSLLDMSNVIMLNTSSESPCAAIIGDWPTATLSETPCAELGLVATETWTIGEGEDITPVTSGYEFPIGETTVTYTASYTYNDETVSSNAYFIVIVSDDAAPVLTSIVDKAFDVNVDGCMASIPTTGMDVVINGLCTEEEAIISWSIVKEETPEEGEEPVVTTLYSGTGQIPASELDIELPVGEYTVNYYVQDASSNDASTSFAIVVNNPLTAMIEGPTTPAIKNELTTSVVRFTGIDGQAPYKFTYDKYVNDVLTEENTGLIATTLAGSDEVTVTQSNGVVGDFKYVLTKVQDRDGNGCSVDLNQSTTVSVRLANGADVTMNVRILPATVKAGGPAKALNFEVRNIGDVATTGNVKFTVLKPRLSGCELTVGAGWTITSTTTAMWTIESTTPPAIGSGVMISVPATLKYTGADKGTSSITTRIATGSGGDVNSGNNVHTRKILIN